MGDALSMVNLIAEADRTLWILVHYGRYRVRTGNIRHGIFSVLISQWHGIDDEKWNGLYEEPWRDHTGNYR